MSNSIEQNLVTIAENRQKIYDAGRNAVINELKELQKGTANGEVVAISDISPIPHNIDVKVSSKNIVNADVLCGKQFTKNDDGSYTFTMGSGGNRFTAMANIFIPKGSKVVFSITGFESDNIALVGIQTLYANGTYLSSYDVKPGYLSNKAIKTEDDIVGLRLYLNQGTAEGATVKLTGIQLEYGTVATAYTPYVDVSTVKLDALGKNLWDADLNKIAPVQYTSATSGGMAKRNGWEMELVAGVTYTVKATPKESSFTESYLYGCVTDKDDKVKKTTPLVANQQLQTHTFTAEDGWKLKLYDGIAQNGLTDTKTMVSKFNIQLEIGEKATPYEPHIQPVTYIPNADGAIEGVKSVCPNMTLLTNTEGVMIECNYKKDINPIFDKYVRD